MVASGLVHPRPIGGPIIVHMAHMRLVTHEQLELEDEMFGDDDEALDVSDTTDVAEPGVRDGADADAPDAMASGEGESAEHPDGTVEDAAGESAADAKSADIDLSLLEALLFSTHHPLTAGRLAELIELESTKPIRKAIKDLNAQ